MKKILFCFAFLLAVVLLFTSCENTEKIIYRDGTISGGTNNDGTTNEDNTGNTITTDNRYSREKFNSIPISQEFNSVDELMAYMHNNRTTIVGKKFKIKGHFSLRNNFSDTTEAVEQYYYKSIDYYDTSTSILKSFSVSFIGTDLNSTINSIEDVIFIAESCSIYPRDTNTFIGVSGYSYL